MSLRFLRIALIAAMTLSAAAAVAQDAGLRRLSPPPVATPPRRATPPPARPPARPPAQPATAPDSAAARPAASIAAAPRPVAATLPPIGGRPVIIIDSRRIGDPAGSVIEVSRASRQVVQEFAPRTQELVKLKTEAEKTQAAADAARGREKDSLTAKARLQKAEFDTRNAALEKEFKARTDTLLAPIQARINDSLKAFAIAQGATIVLDGARFNGAVLAMKAGTDPASLDLTTMFIDGYNRAHP